MEREKYIILPAIYKKRLLFFPRKQVYSVLSETLEVVYTRGTAPNIPFHALFSIGNWQEQN